MPVCPSRTSRRAPGIVSDRPEVATRRFVVVSGLPGGGKSTLARPLAPLLGLPVVDKDDRLEALFADRAEGAPLIERNDRQRLSQAADEKFRARALASDGALLVSFWRRAALSSTSGTPTDWLADLGPITEVWCDCPPATAAERFVRRRRHPGRPDQGHERPAQPLHCPGRVRSARSRPNDPGQDRRRCRRRVALPLDRASLVCQRSLTRRRAS